MELKYLLILELSLLNSSTAQKTGIQSNVDRTYLHIVEELRSSTMIEMLKTIEEYLIAQDEVRLLIDIHDINYNNYHFYVSLVGSIIDLINGSSSKHLVVEFISSSLSESFDSVQINKLESSIQKRAIGSVEIRYQIVKN